MKKYRIKEKNTMDNQVVFYGDTVILEPIDEPKHYLKYKHMPLSVLNGKPKEESLEEKFKKLLFSHWTSSKVYSIAEEITQIAKEHYQEQECKLCIQKDRYIEMLQNPPFIVEGSALSSNPTTLVSLDKVLECFDNVMDTWTYGDKFKVIRKALEQLGGKK